MRLLYLSMAEGQVHVAQSYVGRDDLVVVCRIVDVVAQIVHEVDLGWRSLHIAVRTWNFPEGQAARRC